MLNVSTANLPTPVPLALGADSRVGADAATALLPDLLRLADSAIHAAIATLSTGAQAPAGTGAEALAMPLQWQPLPQQQATKAAPATTYAAPDPAAQAAQAAHAAEAAQAASQRKEKQIHTISILGRYADKFNNGDKGRSAEDIKKMIDAEDTPPDLKEALKYLQSDSELTNKLDGAYRNGKTDGIIADSDIKTLAKDPEVLAYTRKQAKLYTQNYVPSDDHGKTGEGRPITDNDAKRELYRYSDNLPPEVSRKDLQQIVDGTGFKGNENKRPPQLIAAAQYYLDHPTEWKDLTGKDGNAEIGQDKLKNAIAVHTRLSDDEIKTVDTLRKHSDKFFGDGYLTKEGLGKLEKSDDKEVAEAARQLGADPMLFHMLDNGKHGHDHDFFHNSDDGKIGKEDVDKFWSNVLDKTPAAKPPTSKPATPQAAGALAEMLCGELNQPDEKHKKDGQIEDIGHVFLKVFSFIADIGSKILSGLAALKIPGLSQLAGLASMGANALKGGLNVADAQLETGSTKSAGIAAAADFAGQAVSVVTAPGVGSAVAATAGGIAKDAAKETAKALGKEAGKAGYDAATADSGDKKPNEDPATRGLAEDTMKKAGGSFV